MNTATRAALLRAQRALVQAGEALQQVKPARPLPPPVVMEVSEVDPEGGTITVSPKDITDVLEAVSAQLLA